ncbi:AAA family ATPase [Methylobacterium sp. 37f]|uniref:AAA family ATPase n=1 Tax=Methylobacterium sp. 37f TaxID=2817058 RepID=UPI001FFCCA16|nr:AAA family ATPase [Methylobacterium sp. 37f]MCK2057164.1 AAA family ATPase [Methylobacterium sp. 37f]
MSSDDDKKASDLAAANARGILLDPTFMTGPREPSRPVDLSKLAAGGEFVGWCARQDARLRITGMLEHTDLPIRIRDVLQRAIADTTIARLQRAQAALRGLADGKRTPEVTSSAAQVLADELEFNLGALGSAKANAAACALSLHRAYAAMPHGSPAKIWLFLTSALASAADSQVELAETGYITEPRRPRLAAFDEMAHRLAQSMAAVSGGVQMIADEEGILRGGAGVWAPETPEISAELAGIVWPDEIRRPAPSVAPTLVALAKGALDHLPGSEASGSSRTSRASTPRGEWGYMAGVALPLVHGIDVAAARKAIDARFPWYADLTAVLLRDLSHGKFAKFRNTLAVSPPGSGKTSYFRFLCETCGIPCVVHNAAGVSDSSYGGTSRQWSTGRVNFSFQTMARFKVANPVIIIDEADKSGTRSDNGKLTDTLIAMLEPAGSRAYLDPYLEAEVNLSAVQYLATANSTDGIPSALLDRFRVIHVGLPRAQDLAVAAANLVGEIREERGLDAAWMPDLDAEELALVARVWKGGSLRPLRRAVTALLDSRETLARRH